MSTLPYYLGLSKKGTTTTMVGYAIVAIATMIGGVCEEGGTTTIIVVVVVVVVLVQDDQYYHFASLPAR